MSAGAPPTNEDLHREPSHPVPTREGLSSLFARAVPTLADWCIIDLLDDEGALARRLVRTAMPSRASVASALQREGRLDLNARGGAARAFRTGTSQLLASLTSADMAALGPAKQVRALGARSCLSVPLLASGATVGVLTLMRGDGRPPFTPDELGEAEALCRGWMGDGNGATSGTLSWRAEEVLDWMFDGFALLDRGGCFAHLNRQAERLLGRKRHELLGKQIWEEFPEGMDTLFYHQYHRTLAEGMPVEFEAYYPPLSTWFEVRSFPIPGGMSVFFRDINARHQADSEKQRLVAKLESEQRLLQDLLEQLPVGVVARDLSGHLLFTNRRLEQLLGRKVPDDGRQIRYLRDDGQPLPYEELPTSRVARTGEGVPELIFRVEKPDGEQIILRAIGAPMRDTAGRMFATLAICEDITEQKKAVESLLESVRRFRSLVEATSAVIWIANDRGELVEDSASWMAFTGQTPEEHRGLGWLNAVHPDDRWRILAAWRRSERTRTAYEVEYRVRRKDGTYAYTRARGVPVFGGDGAVHEWIGTNVDITARREAEEALREETEIADALNRTRERLAAELDFKKLVQLLTDEAVRLTGARYGALFKASAERGQPFRELYAVSGLPREVFEGIPLPKSTPLLDPSLSGKAVLRLDDTAKPPGPGRPPLFQGSMPAGHPRPGSVLIASVGSRDEEVRGTLFLGHPEPGAFTHKHERLLTGLLSKAAATLENARLYEKARQAEERAQRAATLGEEFMAILGHDLRSPLQAVYLSTHLLLERGELSEAQAKAVSRIASNAGKMKRLVSDLLDFTRARLGEGLPVSPRPTDLHELCRRAAEELEVAWPNRRLKLELRGDGNGEWDPDRMSQVLTNLLDNAMKYSPEDSQVTLRSWGDEHELKLEIHNEGEPIPPELLPTLFQPFRRGKKDDPAAKASLGLGLYIVREILTTHGGTIGVRSAAGEGTTFTIRLPRHR